MYYIYILTNNLNTTFYIEHQQKFVAGFTKKYNITKLVYFEESENVEEAIKREKQLKNWHRGWKINLIKSSNPKFEDLIKTIL